LFCSSKFVFSCSSWLIFCNKLLFLFSISFYKSNAHTQSVNQLCSHFKWSEILFLGSVLFCVCLSVWLSLCMCV
jgi:hypothetical protein